jgi:hypothetical protein
VRVFLALYLTCRRGPKMGLNQEATWKIWASGKIFTKDALMMTGRRMRMRRRICKVMANAKGG